MAKDNLHFPGQMLANIQHTIVYVDPETRRPIPHPQEYIDRFGAVKPGVIFDNFA